MIRKGFYISVDGVRLSGKTALVAALAERFKAAGISVTIAEEPSGTDFGAELEKLATGFFLFPFSQFMLVTAARNQLVQSVILPALLRGDVVITDRSFDSSFAYTGAGKPSDLPVQVVEALTERSAGAARPDIAFLLDGEAATFAARADASATDSGLEIRAREAFLEAARRNPTVYRILPADGLSPDDLTERAWKLLGPVARSRGVLPEEPAPEPESEATAPATEPEAASGEAEPVADEK